MKLKDGGLLLVSLLQISLLSLLPLVFAVPWLRLLLLFCLGALSGYLFARSWLWS